MSKLVLKIKKRDLMLLSLRYGILLKGGKYPPGSIRNWGGVEYVKQASGEWRRKVQKKEPWDSSSEKAKELKISDFGTPEEVCEMAKMPRTAKNKNEAISILQEIASLCEIVSKSGVIASLSKKSIGKIVNDPAIHQSFNVNAHWKAAANVDKLFSSAIEPWEFKLNPSKNNENLKSRRYFYAPMEYDSRTVIVKLTVKEYKQEASDKRLYSIEAIDVDLQAKK